MSTVARSGLSPFPQVCVREYVLVFMWQQLSGKPTGPTRPRNLPVSTSPGLGLQAWALTLAGQELTKPTPQHAHFSLMTGVLPGPTLTCELYLQLLRSQGPPERWCSKPPFP